MPYGTPGCAPGEGSSLRILVLGGTVFLGRHFTAAALGRGHHLTLFHRGLHGADLFPAAEHVLGERDGGVDAVAGRSFDAVVDFSGTVPRVVRQSLDLLRDRADRYLFVSSVSAYRDFRTIGMDETAPLAELPQDEPEDRRIWYGAQKARSEAATEAAFPDRSLIIRPGLIVGPHDPTDRFTYWVVRAERGGEILAPGEPTRPVQVIDVRDLAVWMLDLLETGATGVYNASGPEKPLTTGELLEACREASDETSSVTWVDDDFLLQRGVEPWIGLPLWIPSRDEDDAGMFQVSSRAAITRGLAFRPLRETVRDTLRWVRERPGARRLASGVGLAPEREAELLEAWLHQAKA